MDFQELCARTVEHAGKYSAKYGVVIDEEFALLKLCEEVGELAQAALIARGRCRSEKMLPPDAAREAVAHELADIVGMAIITANLMGIDLQEAMGKKWMQKDV